MDISLALKVLRNAPPQALQNHRQEAIEAFRDIEARLRELDSSSVEQPTAAGQAKIKPSHSTNLLTALNKTASWVWCSTNRRPDEVLGIKRPRDRDRRLGDVRRIEGEPQAKPKYKLLRVLAQRSLALQGEKSGYLDVESYCKVASSREKDKAHKGRGGKSPYMQETARQYGSASGISAFTALAVSQFKNLKYEEIPEFLDCLLKSDSMNLPALVDNPGTELSSITEVIQKSSGWLCELQTYYDRFLDIREDFDKQQSNERIRMRRISLNSSVHDFTNSSTESPPSSDRPSAIESTSPRSNKTRSHPPTSPQESLEQPMSEFSGSSYSTGREASPFVGHGQSHTRPSEPPSQRRLPLIKSQMEGINWSDCAGTLPQRIFNPSRMPNSAAESPISPLPSSENHSNIENTRSDIVSSTSQPQDPSIQPEAGISDSRNYYNPWLYVHATSQPHDPSIQPCASTNDAQIQSDDWPNVHTPSQPHDPSIQPEAGISDSRNYYDPWMYVHATSQPHDPSIQPYASTNDTQIQSDDWPNVHAPPQPHDPSIQSEAGISDSRNHYNPWLYVHATSQPHGPPIQPYVSTNAQIQSDNWPNVHATFRLNDPSLAPYASTNNTQVSFDSSQQVPSQRAVYQHPARSALPLCMTAQVQMPLQAT
ncbi:hypothetical protein N7449_006245 [Penicillium cf. viridicatum]|uniref:Uncharacterized protein n=1 Tax=Penicillium cf. viridicatum TaxID=2972119 RepID=A0A9W9JK42_9EURO|nr:hypothetical protein N7449_006245 [Penicillium cf. viridicatum]